MILMHSRKKRTRHLGRIERDILEQLSFGDLTYGFLLSARSTRRMFKLARERAMDRYRRKKALERLMDLEFVLRGAEKLTITEKGTSMLQGAIMRTAKLLGTEWDGKWRIVIFDIPEKYAVLRNRVRFVLKRAGFIQFQLSVWIFPYECRELVTLIQEESQLAKFILYGTLEQVENEDLLKKHFKL